ncbi:unnamed protein product [Urochloa humidicola]
MVEYIPLTALRPKDRQSVICVRVIRKWEFRGNNEKDPIQHIDLVLADQKGNAMYAEIPAPQVETHGPKLQENGTYTIKYFTVSNVKEKFRPVNASYMLQFTFWTEINPAINPPETFPRYIYRLTEFEDLFTRIGDKTYFLDVLAVITEVGEPVWKFVSSNEGSAITRNIMLEDINGNELKLTLWGTRAQEFSVDNVYNARDAKPIVTLFVGCLMKTMHNEPYLSGSSACKWYFNPEIPEAEAFRARLRDQRIEIKRSDTVEPLPLQPPAPPTVQTKTLQELMIMHPFDFPTTGCQCTVTIARLVPSTFWWYPGCKICNKSMTPEGSGYKCRNCNHTDYSYRLKIPFIATDGTAEAEMICFGSTATRIVGKSCDYVMRSARQGQNVPPTIAAIVSEKFTFTIKLTDDSYRFPKKTFIINSVITSHGKQRVIPQIQTIGESSAHVSSSRLLIQNPPTDTHIPTTTALQTSLRTPQTTQPETVDAPPFEPNTPDDLSVRKRLFSSCIDSKQGSDQDSTKITKTEQSPSDIKEHDPSPAPPERSPSGNQTNLPAEEHPPAKKLHYQKK